MIVFAMPYSPRRHRRSTQTVLQQPDHHTQKQTCRRIAPAKPKINGHQQRQIEDREFRECTPAPKSAETAPGRSRPLWRRHGTCAPRCALPLFAGRRCRSWLFTVLAVPGPVFLVDARRWRRPQVSFLSSSGCSDSSTITSSRLSRFAAGRRRNCLKGISRFDLRPRFPPEDRAGRCDPCRW